MSAAAPLAHGIGAVRDLPVPGWLFLYGAAVVLLVSFVALGALWRRPVLETRAAGRPLSPRLQRVLLGPELRIVLGLVSVALLVLVAATALLGEDAPERNFAPTFVYVVFWLGLVPVVVLLGDVWRALNPWRAVADAVAWFLARVGLTPSPPLRYPDALGRWPAAVLLLAFATLELAYPEAARPRMLAVAILLYSAVTWLGVSLFGRRAWLENGEAFTVYFGLLALLAPFAVRESDGKREALVRAPLAALARRDERPGTIPFVAVMLGAIVFDGFSRTSFWIERVSRLQTSFGLEQQRLADLAVTAYNLTGMIAAVALVATAFSLAVESARVVARRRESLAEDFVRSLVPIALAYAVAHYFTLLLTQGQAVRALVSDPFGYGWDLFGTADFQPRLDVLAPNTVWYVQVATLVVGHVLGLAVAHDRAVTLFRSTALATRTQYAMLALMVLYTVSGLWLLSKG